MNNTEMQGPQMPMSEEEYLDQVAHDMPGGKPPSRAKAMLLLALGAALVFGILIVYRNLGLV
ncbi:MAG: hypothetical protein IKM54_00610 [Butyricicoccus sp.]|nr:hypothetical protein [Butyricicoccus sp.]